MERQPIDIPADRDIPYHAHIYYSADQRAAAGALRRAFERLTSAEASRASCSSAE